MPLICKSIRRDRLRKQRNYAPFIDQDVAHKTVSPIKPLKTTKVFPCNPVKKTKMFAEKNVPKCDVRLLRRVESYTSGLEPPPCYTITDYDVGEMLTKWKEGEKYLWGSTSTNGASSDAAESSSGSLDNSNKKEDSRKSLLVDGPLESVNQPFPDVMTVRQLGLHPVKCAVIMSEEELKITPPRSVQPRSSIENIEKLPVPVKTYINSKSKIYQALLSRKPQVPGLHTSTPDPQKCSQRTMAYFNRLCEESSKSSFHSMLDNDSGYVSHYQESNLDSSSENVMDEPKSMTFSQPILISEDALLEKPEVRNTMLDLSAEIDKEDYEEASRLFNSEKDSSSAGTMISAFCSVTPSKFFNSMDSIVDNSFVSDKTNLSGLETDASDTSLVVPLCENMVVKVNSTFPSMEAPNYSLIDFKEELVEEKVNRIEVQHVDEDMEIDNSICSNETLNNSVCSNEVVNKSICSNGTLNNSVCSNGTVNNSICSNVTGNNSKNDERKTENKSPKERSGVTTVTDVSVNNTVNVVEESSITKEPLQQVPQPQCVLSKTSELPEIKQATLHGKIDKCDNFAHKYASPVKKISKEPKFMPSPDMFADYEEVVPPPNPVQESKVYVEKYALKCDVKLLRRVQSGMSGVIPPPSVTMTNLSVADMLNKWKEGEKYLWGSASVNGESSNAANCSTASLDASNETSQKSLLINGPLENVEEPWPQVMSARQMGLHHNRSKISERFEHLCDKYAQRYVGMETQSSCTVFEVNCSSPKRRLAKPKWSANSPRSRRLSHLARRRITFSSANLQAASSSFIGNRTRQIMIDAKKLELLSRQRSPKRTPKKTPPRRSPIKSRTPSSSAKKKLAMRFRMVSGEIEETYSNCSSVASEKSIFQDDSSRESGLILPSVADERRRLLSLSSNDILNKKRKRTDSESGTLSKLAKMDMQSTREEMKSTLSSLNKSNLLNRSSQSQSDIMEMYRKKLQWTVYEALRAQNVTPSHPEFKTFASTLARVIRRFLPPASSIKPEDLNEKVLKLAKYNVYGVIKGKSVDEIIADYMKAKQKQQSSQKHQQPHSSSQKPSQGVTQSLFLSHSSLPSHSSQRSTSDTRSSLGSSSSSNKENLFRAKSPFGSSSRSHLMLRNSNCTDTRINRIRKVINFGDDNR